VFAALLDSAARGGRALCPPPLATPLITPHCSILNVINTPQQYRPFNTIIKTQPQQYRPFNTIIKTHPKKQQLKNYSRLLQNTKLTT
jgi:hypothetical protein